MYPKIGLRLNTGKISVAIPKNGRAKIYTSGCPKNQKRCCQSIAPPFAGSKICDPNNLSDSNARNAAASGGNASRTRIDVKSTFQLKIDILNIVIPGARIVKIVVMKFTPPRIVPIPPIARPITQRSPPMPGEYCEFASGAYAVQPNEAAPPGVKKPAKAISPPNRKSQYDNMFIRGNATSAAPICNGMITFAKPTKSGVANISNIMVPCIVKTWLYCSLDTNCRPGRANSARNTSARTPPIINQTKVVTRYI
ncbi:unannotated protein [freshwater metagenome]|uniref:Unannotated protein n=1 Tax=freshwater metagenome TaxID=449393 RepID=A0A6J6URU0_9ZZZZ